MAEKRWIGDREYEIGNKPEQAPSECECGHGLQWHHHRRGCGYHGFSADHRCPCPMPFDDALAAHDRRVRAEALREAADRMNVEGLSFKPGGWGSNAADQQTIAALVTAVAWLRDRADRVSPVPDPSRPEQPIHFGYLPECPDGIDCTRPGCLDAHVTEEN